MITDFAKSREKAHQTRIMRAKIAREYLIQHPGATNAEVSAAGGSVSELQSLGLAYWKREDGVARWYAKTGVSRPWRNEDELNWNPETMRFE